MIYTDFQQNQHQLTLEQLAEDGMLCYDPYKIFEDQLSLRSYKNPNGGQTLYFMSMMLRRKHSKASRKVASFGIAIGSRYKIVENYK